MDDALRDERSALSRYREMLDSGELDELAFYRELAVREHGELVQRMLDEHDVSSNDPLRLSGAKIADSQRELLRRLGPDLLEDGSDLLEGEAT